MKLQSLCARLRVGDVSTHSGVNSWPFRYRACEQPLLACLRAHLREGSRNELAVTMLQKPHAQGGFGLTPNVLPQISAKVAMASRFLQLVGSLPPEEQQLWLPNQTAQDPDSWHAPHLLNLKMGYDILVNNHDSKVEEMYTVQ